MVRFAAVAGTTYRIAVDGFAASAGAAPKTGKIVLRWRDPLANDNFDAATVLTGASGMVTGMNEREQGAR